MARKLENLRNIGIIAHIDAGKTTLTERMLFYAGSTHRMGEVDKGTTRTDVDEEEQQRGITIYAACITFDWKDVTVNLIDTPGHVDFTAEVERCLRVLDGGVVVFSAREGVEAQSETVWRQADRYQVPRIALINKMDREGANFEAVVSEIEKRLEANPVVLQIPIGAGPPHVDNSFRGIIDLVSMKQLGFGEANKDTEVTISDIPEDEIERAEEWRAKMLEQLYDYSNELMELGLEEAPVPDEVLKKVVRNATLHRLIVPVMCGSALDCIGVQPVLDAVADYLPSPADMPPVEGIDPKKEDHVERRKPSADEPFCGLVFKIQAEKHGDLAYVRVYSGKLASNTRILNPGKYKKDNAAQLWHVQPGGKENQVKEVEAGDIVGVIGLRHSITGDTICDTQKPIILEKIRFPETVISMAIEPESSTERKKLGEALDLMKRQDPTFRATEYKETGQTLISGMGELHLEVIKHRLLRDFNLDVKVHKPRVSYRETVQNAVEVSAECHRQIAGQDTFAALQIKLEPLAEGTEAEGVGLGLIEGVPLPLIQAAREELEMLSGGGGHYGFPLTRVRFQITGGEARDGESTEAAFRIAAGEAFDKALQAAGVILLEPIMNLEIVTPEENLGDIIANLQQKRALIHSTDTRGRNTVITAEAPLASLFGFAGELRGLSQGRATCSMEPGTYGPAPPDMLDSLV